MKDNDRKGRSDTRRQVLDAALEIVAERGLQSLTHRGVESRANVSHGVTTYYFKNREALIDALYEHICDSQTTWITEMYQKMHAAVQANPEQFEPETYTRQAVHLLLAEKSMTLARYEMYLHAARNPRLREAARLSRDRHAEIQAELFLSMGARDPILAARRMLSATEGLLLYQIAMPEEDFEEWAVPYLGMLADGLVEFDRAATSRHTAWSAEPAH